MLTKILIVEDEFITALALKKNLDQKYEICGISQSGSEAVIMAEQLKPDILLMDINLSGEMDGIQTAEKIKLFLNNIIVIYLTGFTDSESIERAKVTEPFGYIIKPFNMKEVESTINIAIYKKDVETKLKQNERELKKHKDNLEILVKERTRELEEANNKLQEEIHERKLAEAELRKKEEHLRLIIESVKEYAIYTIDTNGYINSWNQGAERLIGYSETEILEKHISIFIPEEPNRIKVQDILSSLSVKGDFKDEGWIFKKDGSKFWADTLYTSMRDHEGNFIGSIEITRNLTERKMMEDEIKQALEKEKELRELKNRFISMASHEFRTPLSVILSSSEIVKYYRKKMADNKLDEYLDSIFNEVKNMTNILDSVLLIGRIDSGKVSFQPSNFDLHKLCKDTIEKIRSGYSKQVSMYLFYNAESNFYILDERLVQQILNNLISNAVKYSTPGKKVEITVDKINDEIRFEIKDEGIGIPEEEVPNIYEPFHRANNVGAVSGTGLGLVIVKNSVEIHKGRIELQSKLNQGTAFRVYLPLTNKSQGGGK